LFHIGVKRSCFEITIEVGDLRFALRRRFMVELNPEFGGSIVLPKL